MYDKKIIKQGKYLDKPMDKFFSELLSNLKHQYIYYEYFVNQQDEEDFFQFMEEMGLIVLYKLFMMYISKEAVYQRNFDTWFISKKMVYDMMIDAGSIIDEDFTQENFDKQF